jgi:hypothetical protein
MYSVGAVKAQAILTMYHVHNLPYELFLHKRESRYIRHALLCIYPDSLHTQPALLHYVLTEQAGCSGCPPARLLLAGLLGWLRSTQH